MRKTNSSYQKQKSGDGIKDKVIKVRLSEDIHKKIVSKAEKDFDGNISCFIRWAAVSCIKAAPQSVNSDRENRIIALLTSIKKNLNKMGVNLNQVTKAINEKKKMSPLAFSVNDLSPFRQFCDDMKTNQDMCRYIYNLLVE